MDSLCIKQTVCKVLKISQYGKYLVAYVLKIALSYGYSIVCPFYGVAFDPGFVQQSTSGGKGSLLLCYKCNVAVCAVRIFFVVSWVDL